MTSDLSEPPKQLGGRRSVRIPDFFSSIMASRPVVNPNYSKVKTEGDRWISRVMKMDQKTSAKNARADFCYLASTWAPHADEEALRMLLDWCNWFDEGHLKSNPFAAQDEVDRTMAIMENGAPFIEPEENPIRYVFQTCWHRVQKSASLELQQRYREQHRRFFDQLVAQVQQFARGEFLGRDLDTYSEVRRGTIGVYAAIAATEYAEGIKLPERTFCHNSLQECIRISAELAFLVNDVLSYRKDLELGVGHNLITFFMEQSMSVQQSVDKIGSMADGCYKRWYTALAELPLYGEEIDREVLAFVEVCRYIALGNLHWSFKTGRYLGSEGEDVHETRLMYLAS
ncbi:Presilphiperfolan-8-beta-ol synthase [Xylaria longipes]|nr:Presilphiperfolan-8-beta-ol synthase [Xylaria longipes]